MKKYLLILCIGLLGVSYSKSASNCENKLLVKLLQDLLDSSNLVRPWTRHILEVVNDIDECCDANGSQLDVIESLVENISVSSSDELILSQLDIIEGCCSSNGSQLEVIESLVENIAVSGSDELILSQLDIIEGCCASSSDVLDTLSQNDELILSQLDVIESTVDSNAACCASSSDVLGELTDIGSCLDSAIDVPDDINNLTLTVIALLKTILLDLRGCNIP